MTLYCCRTQTQWKASTLPSVIFKFCILWLYETYLNSIWCTSPREWTHLYHLTWYIIRHFPEIPHLMCHHFSLFCCGCFGFFLATSQSGICSCCSPPCQTSDDPCAILRLPTKQAKFHTWRAQRKLLWLQFVLRHLLVWLRLTGWMNWEHLRRLIRAVVCIWCSLDLIFFFFYTYSEMRITGVHSGSTEARLIFHQVPHQMQASEFAVVQSELTNFTAIILSWGGWMPKTSNVRSLY